MNIAEFREPVEGFLVRMAVGAAFAVVVVCRYDGIELASQSSFTFLRNPALDAVLDP
jgi:hypothetical protein